MTATRRLSRQGVEVPRFGVRALSSKRGAKLTQAPPGEALRVGRREGPDDPRKRAWLLVDDRAVSVVHLEFVATPEGVVVRDTSTNGTWVGPMRVQGAQVLLSEGVDLRVGETDLRLEIERVPETIPVSTDTSFGDLVGASASMQRLFAKAQKFAATNLPVLITGETGTGKSRLAHAIHQQSARRGGPFVEVDCTLLTETLINDQLFGHAHGAFTGASEQRVGVFEAARGGTVFLDEIGELSVEAQRRFLRVLEARKVQRLGEVVDRDVDVRVVAATHCDINAMVNARRFRLDLYERLAVGVVEVPPLRERRDDLPAIARTLVDRIRADGDVPVPDGFALTDAQLDELAQRRWAGNVRELYNHLRYLLVTGEQRPEVMAPGAATRGAIAVDDLLEQPLREAERALMARFDKVYLPHALERAGQRIGEAAQAAQVDPKTFRRRWRECGLEKTTALSETSQE